MQQISPFLVNDRRLDANESIWFSRQLEYIYTDILRIKYPELMARKLIPKGKNTDPASRFTTFRMYDISGLAKLIGSLSTDIPMVDANAKEETTPVHSLAAGFSYSINDIRAGVATGLRLEDVKAMAARELIERLIEDLSATGDANTGLPGFLNHANVPDTAASTVSSATTWAAKQALNASTTSGLLSGSQAIYNDMVLPFSRIAAVTKGRESPDTLVLPPAQYEIAANTPYSQFAADSILSKFLGAHPGIEVYPWFKTTGAGAGATDLMVAYKRDAEHVRMEIPQEFEMLAPQADGIHYMIPCHARFGGVIMPYPLAADYTHGI